MKYHYVYIITNKINHKFYIGKHSTNKLYDGYMGSGIAINKAIQKYGIENFSKRILCFCDSAEDAYKIEEFLVTDNLIKRDDCYNMKTGGGQNIIYSEESRAKMRIPKSEECKRKLSIIFKGSTRPEEVKLKISQNHSHWNKGRTNVYSEETKRKMSESHKGKIMSTRGKPKQKFKWLTPTGEIKEMNKSNVIQYHPDWVLYEQN